jgi:hypothetical protein
MTNGNFAPEPAFKVLVPKTNIGGSVNSFTVSLAAFVFSGLEVIVKIRDNTNISFTVDPTFRFNSSGTPTYSQMKTKKTGLLTPVAVESTINGAGNLSVSPMIGTDAPANAISTYIFRIYETGAARDKFLRCWFYNPFDGNAGNNWGELTAEDNTVNVYDQLTLGFSTATLQANSSYQINRLY